LSCVSLPVITCGCVLVSEALARVCSLMADVRRILKPWKKYKDALQSASRDWKTLTYCQRLTRLKLDSLELRRVCLDLIFTYKLVFGLTDLKLSHFFVLRNDARSRGHPYKLFLPGCSSTTRHNYFAHRVAWTWNKLPEDSTNFSSLALFKRCLNSNVLVRHCKIYYF